MPDKNLMEQKHIALSIDQPQKLSQVARALATTVRLGILKALSKQSMHVNEIAQVLDLPVSTVALNVNVLEQAGLITAELLPGTRGAMKLCSRCVDSLSIGLKPPEKNRCSEVTMSMPIGCYSDCQVKKTCGIVSEHGYIGVEDDPRSFYQPDRFAAQHLWFRAGYLEYRFSSAAIPDSGIVSLECSFEACSEAPYYRNDWPSDITFWVNGVEIGTWRSPGDLGGRRGQFNPSWWLDTATQYGHLKTWRIDSKGSWLDNLPLSNVIISDLKLETMDFIAVRIGIKPDAKYPGGISLFGEKFGDYQQNILLTLGTALDT